MQNTNITIEVIITESIYKSNENAKLQAWLMRPSSLIKRGRKPKFFKERGP
jgi:hypothetical protein